MVASLLAVLALVAHAGPPRLLVSGASGCAVAPTRAQLISGARACTITAAEHVARPGDLIPVAAGVYPPTRISASGTRTAPIVVAAAPGTVRIVAAGGRTALRISQVHDVTLRGVSVTGGRAQAVWVDASVRVGFVGVKVSRSAGHGVQVNSSRRVTITSSVIAGNRSAGIMETGADAGDRYVSDTISGNGTGGPRYLGSGVELTGSGSQVVGCTIAHNGRSRLYEHGVYVASTAHGWLISGSTISASSGSDVKAAGSDGTIASSTLGSARLGVYAIGEGVTLRADEIRGSFLDGLVVAGGSTFLHQSVIANAARGWGSRAHAALVYGTGRLHLLGSTLLLRGGSVTPSR